MKNLFKLSPFFLLFSSVYAAGENATREVNPYDCTIEEVQLYMLKKTESSRIDSTIATWEDYKKNAIPVTTAASGGHSANSPENAAVGGETEEETCPMFFTDAQLSDINIDTDALSIGNLIGLLNGEVSGLADTAKDQLSSLSEGLISELEKGVCERLSTEYIGGLVGDAVDNAVEGATGGYDIGDITGNDFANRLIDDSLTDAFGSSGKLLNIFDEDFAERSERVIERETDRQLDELEKEITD